MLQTATIKSPTAHATSKAHGADASNRPAPAAQDAKKSAAETADGFATELNSADIVQTQQPQADAAVNKSTSEELSAATAADSNSGESAGESTDQSQQAGTDTSAEEWILNMLGLQTAQLQARELPAGELPPGELTSGELAGTLLNEAQGQALPGIASLATNAATTETTAEQKLAQAQQALLGLKQAQPQKQMQPELVINNSADSKDDAAVNTVDTTENKTQNASPVPPPVDAANQRTDQRTDQGTDQSTDQTKNTTAALLADRLNGLTPAHANDGSTNSVSSQVNQTLTDAVPERTLKLQGTEGKWGEQMLHALRENVGLQLQHRQQNATIRLDPPELGAMEIFLSHESGRLTVHISAAQGDVARMLQQTSDRLRQELVNQNFVQVNVQVSSDNQGGQRHSQQRTTPWSETQITQNHQGAEVATPSKTSAHNGILVTV